MGTKNNPSPFDCYATADPDEPLFVLLGRDKFAASIVELWSQARESDGEAELKVAEARDVSAAMRHHCYTLRKDAVNVLDYVPFEALACALRRRGATITTAPSAPPTAAPARATPVKVPFVKELANMHHDLLVVMQAAWIEWARGGGAESAMEWIENTLRGPGLIPDAAEPYGSEAQAYYDANRSDPFPLCFCGRPSHHLWMGKGFCCEEHSAEGRAMAEAQASLPGVTG